MVSLTDIAANIKEVGSDQWLCIRYAEANEPNALVFDGHPTLIHYLSSNRAEARPFDNLPNFAVLVENYDLQNAVLQVWQGDEIIVRAGFQEE